MFISLKIFLELNRLFGQFFDELHPYLDIVQSSESLGLD